AKLLWRVIGRDLELATVFEQFREPGWQQTSRAFGNQVREVIRDFAARAAGCDAIRAQQLFPQRVQPGDIRVHIKRKELAPGMSYANEFASQHESGINHEGAMITKKKNLRSEESGS